MNSNHSCRHLVEPHRPSATFSLSYAKATNRGTSSGQLKWRSDLESVRKSSLRIIYGSSTPAAASPRVARRTEKQRHASLLVLSAAPRLYPDTDGRGNNATKK